MGLLGCAGGGGGGGGEPWGRGEGRGGIWWEEIKDLLIWYVTISICDYIYMGHHGVGNIGRKLSGEIL